MVHKAWIGSALACAALCVGSLVAQQRPANDAINGLPSDRGIYYRGASGWVALPESVLMPLLDGGSAKEFFGVGRRSAVAEMPGPRAEVQIRSAKPVFYVRGFSPSEAFYMVQSQKKDDYRLLHMPVSRSYREWAHFRSQDLRDFEIASVADNVFSITPKTDLKPGEYAIASTIEHNKRWIRLGFDFGVSDTR